MPMSAYELLCQLRRRGIIMKVDGGRLESGRWYGGRLIATPAVRLTDLDRARIRKLAHDIRGLLPHMFTPAELELCRRRWAAAESAYRASRGRGRPAA